VNGQPVKFEGFCADVFFAEGMKFIECHKDEPFFCYIASNTPHSPWNIEDKYSSIYKDVAPTDARARFYGTVTNVDENVGRLRAKLEELGLADNTIVIFMTDNGSGGGVTSDAKGFVDEGPCNFNAGMRGTKVWEYEGGHRVPFFLYDPRQERGAGWDIGTLTSYIDFMPTLLDLCGVDMPTERTFHGQSLVPLIEGEPGGNWNERILVTDTQRVARPVKWQKSCVMRNRWRLINGRELYDLACDPGQRVDIADKHPELVAELREGYCDWWDLVSAQFDRDIPFHIGTDDSEVMLTTHDVRNEATQVGWNHKHVRAGMVVSGYWEVDVRRTGRYRFELRRWPREAGHALGAGIEGDDVPIRWDCVQPSFKDIYTGGKPLDIRWSRLIVGDQTLHAEVDPAAASVLFEIDLPQGPTHVYPSFHTGEPGTLAPYYIYIKRI